MEVIWVYPRACGGTNNAPSSDGLRNGLSPRVRGNPHSGEVTVDAQGSIPARAGEPSQSSRTDEQVRVYPRACGGTDIIGAEVNDVEGLSPRVRGNRGAAICAARRERSIPARAGEPGGRGIPTPDFGVYPRACGGTCRRRSAPPRLRGLSPRVRGNRLTSVLYQVPPRSIPARAGEPPGRGVGPLRLQVYPRACGGTLRSRALM